MYIVNRFQILSIQPVYEDKPFWKGKFLIKLPEYDVLDVVQNVELSVFVPLHKGLPAEDILQSLLEKAKEALHHASALVQDGSATELAEKFEQRYRSDLEAATRFDPASLNLDDYQT